MPKKTVKVTDINKLVTEYVQCREQKKQLEERLKDMGTIIKQYALEHGTKDSKGSYYMKNDTYTFGMCNRKTVKVNVEKAIEFAEERGFDSMVVVEKKIDEDVLNALVASQDISEQDLEIITEIKNTQSIYVGENEEEDSDNMPEVQQTKVQPKKAVSSKIRKVKR